MTYSPGSFHWITPGPRGAAAAADDSAPETRRPSWWIRREISFASVPESFLLEIVCLGYYELYVNGKRVCDEPLAPSLSRLDRRGFVIRHDLVPHLRAGANSLGICCSSGWYLPHQFRVHEGATPLLGVRMRCSPNSKYTPKAEWLCRPSNRFSIGAWDWNRFGGEEVDARAYRADWSAVTCDTSDWWQVRRVSPPSIEICERECPPNRIGESYGAQSVRKLGSRCFEVDFGTCLSGWVDIGFDQLDAGQSVTLRFYDVPADTEAARDHSYGQYCVYHASGDGRDRFINKFNYAGFRYMTIDGVDTPPDLEDMEALLVESALERAGQFRCSNALYNRIHDLNVQTLRCLNLGGYSVDCPHRERGGYGADGQTALPAYLYLFDSASFLHKWLIDWCDVYEPDSGRISLCAPTHHSQHAPAWGGFVAPLAWSLYVHYGDRDALSSAFPALRGYLRFLQRAVANGVMRKELLGSVFHGDWVPPRRGMDTQNGPDQPMRELFNSCYLIYLWQIYVKICRVLGQDAEIAEAETCMADLREGVHREFYDPELGLYLIAEQIYQAMPLLTAVVPEAIRPHIRKTLTGLIAENGWHMDTGLPGSTLLLDLLMESGEHEVIGRIYEQETYPGWGYMLAKGATTIWEQWNGYWSRIHSCFAGPAAWFYAGLAGIRPDESGPGFKSFELAPAFLDGLDFVEASYDAAAGQIKSAWHRQDGRIFWSVHIPESCRARLAIPLADLRQLSVNGRSWEGEGARDATGKILLRLPPGHHELNWPGQGCGRGAPHGEFPSR